MFSNNHFFVQNANLAMVLIKAGWVDVHRHTGCVTLLSRSQEQMLVPVNSTVFTFLIHKLKHMQNACCKPFYSMCCSRPIIMAVYHHEYAHLLLVRRQREVTSHHVIKVIASSLVHMFSYESQNDHES